MLGRTEFYINGNWVKPAEAGLIEVRNPATEEAGVCRLGRGTVRT